MNPVISENDDYCESEMFIQSLKSSIHDKTLTPIRKSFEQQCDITNSVDTFLNTMISSITQEVTTNSRD